VVHVRTGEYTVVPNSWTVGQLRHVLHSQYEGVPIAVTLDLPKDPFA